MADIVYKPTSAYSKELDTAISKSNLLTGLMLYGKRINLFHYLDGSTGTQQLIYTVPPGKTFFMTNATVTMYVTGAFVGNYGMGGGSAATSYFYIVGVTSYDGMYTQTKNYPVLMRLVSTEKIYHSITVGVGAAAGLIEGYEIDTALLPTFN